MNLSETAKLLALIAAYDQRTIGEADVVAWQQVLYDVTLPNARAAAVDHYREKTSRIMPADVRGGVRRVRQLALQNAEDPCPPAELADDPAAYRAWQRSARRQIADQAGEPTAAITASSMHPRIDA